MPEEKKEKESGYSEKQLVVFSLGKEEFGVDISEVREIIRFESITKIPNTADFISGVINLRGGIIVVIDLASKLGLPSKEQDNNTRIIVIETEDNTVGMIVDSATEVLRLSGENIKPAPSVITKKINSDYLEGVGVIGERLLILLDLAKVLLSKEITDVKKIQEKSKGKVAEQAKESTDKPEKSDQSAEADKTPEKKPEKEKAETKKAKSK